MANHQLGVRYSPEQVQKKLEEFDHDKNGKLDFSEFMELLEFMRDSSELAPKALASMHAFSVDEVIILRALFDEFDRDGNGTIDNEELVQATKGAIGSAGGEVDESSINVVISKFDTNSDGSMDFSEVRREAP